MNTINNFAVYILTHRRPDRVYTIQTLRKQNYTGSVFLVLDDQDSSIDEYRSRFGQESIRVFSKEEYRGKFDICDNNVSNKGVVFARNAVFDIAENDNIENFLVLDDDYTSINYKVIKDGKSYNGEVKDLDKLFCETLKFYIESKVDCITYAQGGDFIGGIDNGHKVYRFSKRKLMNSFFCSTKRRFNFIGRINEDVNTYVTHQKTGNVFLTVQNIAVIQKQTQSNAGGLTDQYLEDGTYVKSFYSVLVNPAAVRVNMMRTNHSRLHHTIDWKKVCPVIIKDNKITRT
jgi:hypothetical protein